MTTVRVTIEQVEKVTGPNALEARVEEDLREFDAWFQEQGNDPIVRVEKAILKTYLWWKLQDLKELRGRDQPAPSTHANATPEEGADGRSE